MIGTTIPVLPRAIKVKWPLFDIAITIELNDKNPSLVELLINELPYRSLQTHALVVGDHLYHLVPSEPLLYTHPVFKAPNRAAEPDGTMFLSGYQHMAIKYGLLSENFPAAPCGKVVPEDMDSFRAVGNKLWEGSKYGKQPIEVIVWDASKPEPTHHLPLTVQRTGNVQEVKDLVQLIHDETEKSWSGISHDMEAVHNGQAPSGAGSKNSYFSTMLFMSGEIRTLGYTVLNGILKTAATQPHFDLKHLITLFRVFASTSAQFVGYLGADFFWATYQDIDTVIQEKIESNPNTEEAREDFLALTSALARYANLLNAQNLQLFPWAHATEYLIALEEKVQPKGVTFKDVIWGI